MVVYPQEKADNHRSSCASSEEQKLSEGHEATRLSCLCMASSIGGNEKDRFFLELTKQASQSETLRTLPTVSFAPCYSLPQVPGQVDVSYDSDPRLQMNFSACANHRHSVDNPPLEEGDVGQSTSMISDLDGGCLPCVVQSDDADTHRSRSLGATTSRGQASQVALPYAQRPTGPLPRDDLDHQKPLIPSVQEGLCRTTGTDLTFMMPELDGDHLLFVVQSDVADTHSSRPLGATTSGGQASQVALACVHMPSGLLSHDDRGAQKSQTSRDREGLCRTSTGTDLTHPGTVSSFHRSRTKIDCRKARRNGYLIERPGTEKLFLLIADRASRGVRSSGAGAGEPGLSSRPASRGIWHATYQRFCLKEAEDRKKRQE
eukprot:gene32653-17670_t